MEEFKLNLIQAINTVASLVSKEIATFKLMSIEALLTLDVHSRDILSGLIMNKVTSADDFEWTRHLRYEWNDSNNQCLVMQSDASFNYGYEYLGCSARLVITPLTDRYDQINSIALFYLKINKFQVLFDSNRSTKITFRRRSSRTCWYR